MTVTLDAGNLVLTPADTNDHWELVDLLCKLQRIGAECQLEREGREVRLVIALQTRIPKQPVLPPAHGNTETP